MYLDVIGLKAKSSYAPTQCTLLSEILLFVNAQDFQSFCLSTVHTFSVQNTFFVILQFLVSPAVNQTGYTCHFLSARLSLRLFNYVFRYQQLTAVVFLAYSSDLGRGRRTSRKLKTDLLKNRVLGRLARDPCALVSSRTGVECLDTRHLSTTNDGGRSRPYTPLSRSFFCDGRPLVTLYALPNTYD